MSCLLMKIVLKLELRKESSNRNLRKLEKGITKNRRRTCLKK
jgi:hypothetical protein